MTTLKYILYLETTVIYAFVCKSGHQLVNINSAISHITANIVQNERRGDSTREPRGIEMRPRSPTIVYNPTVDHIDIIHNLPF